MHKLQLLMLALLMEIWGVFGVNAQTASVYNTLVKFNWFTNLVNQNVEFQALTTDIFGDIFVGGNFTGSLTIGSLSVSGTAGTTRAFVLKLSNAGNPLWLSAESGSAGYSTVTSLCVNTPATQDVYAGGWAYNSSTNGGTQFLKFNTCTSTLACKCNLPMTNNMVGFIAEFNSSGMGQWTRTIGTGASNSMVEAINMGYDESLAVAGHFNGSGAFLGPTLTSRQINGGYQSQEGFLCFFATGFNPLAASDNQALWAVTTDVPNSASAVGTSLPSVDINSVSFTSDNEIVVAGDFIQNAMTNDLVSSNHYAGLVAEWNYSGTLLWDTALAVTNAGDTFADCVCADNYGGLYIAGRTGRENTSQPALLTIRGQTPGVSLSYSLHGQTDGYLIRFNDTGDPQWITTAYGAGGSTPSGYVNFHSITAGENDVVVAGNEQLLNSSGILFGDRAPLLTNNLSFIADYSITNGSLAWIKSLPQSVPVTTNALPLGLQFPYSGGGGDLLVIAGWQSTNSYLADLAPFQTDSSPWLFLTSTSASPAISWYGAGTLLSSADLKTWQVLATNWPAINSLSQFSDPSGTTQHRRFYRLTVP